VALSLIAFDTDHIKSYVFGTDKLKEIRGASSILDRLNRDRMLHEASTHHIRVEPIFTNGGAGLFLVDKEGAEDFGHFVQNAYLDETKGRASITYVVQRLPAKIENLSIEEIKKEDLGDTLELLRYRLHNAKNNPSELIAITSHPFMHPCDSCGTAYAEKEITQPPDEAGLYCMSCMEKRKEDGKVKNHILDKISRIARSEQSSSIYLWDRILEQLKGLGYALPEGTQPPNDFNEFRLFTEAKEYIGLIYADGNNMGAKQDDLKKLVDVEDFAKEVDDAVHRAMCQAIKDHLPVVERPSGKQDETIRFFPFDILMIGGDDIMLVTDAAKAMDVALTIAREFRGLTNNKYTLSVGVILAPIKYPFGLLLDMAETTLKFAKKAGADARIKAKREGVKEFDDTRINFLTVAGSSRNNFNAVYNSVYHAKDKDKNTEFFASLRPYDPDKLAFLLDVIRQGHIMNLGRTKLHQVREAILKKNLTTSVTEGLMVLRNWREKQRNYVTKQVYSMAGQYQLARSNTQDPGSLFPRVTFPWFADGETKDGLSVYRTSLLDFVELYDFVSREGLDESDES